MTPAEAHLWSCHRRKVRDLVITEANGGWRLTVKLECGHEALQDFKVHQRPGRFVSAAWRTGRERAQRVETNLRRVGWAPCIACGPST